MNQGSDLFFYLGKWRRRISFLLSFLVFDVGSAVSEVVINSRQMKGKSAFFLQKILGCAFPWSWKTGEFKKNFLFCGKEEVKHFVPLAVNCFPGEDQSCSGNHPNHLYLLESGISISHAHPGDGAMACNGFLCTCAYSRVPASLPYP